VIGARNPERGTLWIAAPLGLEAWALRGAVPGARVVRTGMGPLRAQRAAQRLRVEPAGALAVAGLCGALDPELEPGDVVIGSALLGPESRRVALDAAPLAAALARAGIAARVGDIVSVSKPVTNAGRTQYALHGACAVDMESFWLAEAAVGRPFAVLRVVLDGPRHELWRADLPLRVATSLRRLRAAAPALAAWAAEVSPTASDAPARAVTPSSRYREPSWLARG
jgi:4-hydroxy-3-methylbut-2-enyl diphosphate reductase